MKIIRNKFIPFKGFKAINIFGVVFTRSDQKLSEVTINHEKIHTAQMRETLYVLYYPLYLLAWAFVGFSYDRHPMENECEAHEADPGYLKRRKLFAWLRGSDVHSVNNDNL
ncbi:hypothetical protein PM708P2_00045 [Parabacteroides phage PM708P2]|nr:hypothetical protein PM708P2_00045 [Parabacteroides phage PM708P2]